MRRWPHPWRSRRELGLAVVMIACAACGGRERTNPFDPANSDVHGEPASLRATAACRRVDLAWDDLEMRDRTGFRVWRAPPANVESLLTSTPLDRAVLTYADTSARNGVLYRYRIEYLFGEASGFSAPVSARPGPALVWCADPCGWGVALLTPDGRENRARFEEGRPTYDLAVDAGGQRLFAAAPNAPGAVIVLATDGSGVAREIPLVGPTCVSWSAAARVLVVGAFFESRVVWLRDAGETLRELDTAGTPRRYPEDVAMRDSSCTWIALSDATRRSGLLLRMRLGARGADTLGAAIGRPVAVADDAGRGCWLADRTGAVVYATDDLVSIRSATGELRDPTDVTADGSGLCWVADHGAGALVLVDRDCAVLRRIEPLAGVVGVTFDPQTETLWATMPDDGRVVAIDASSGEPIGSVLLSGCPIKVEGDWTNGCSR